MMVRKKLPIDIKKHVLHEAGYKCANPSCRYPITLDIHHIEKVSDMGGDSPDNLVALCPNCHREHHSGNIPVESIRAWKMLLLTLNEGYDRKAIDLLLVLRKMGWIWVSGDGLLDCTGLLSSGLISAEVNELQRAVRPGWYEDYILRLTPKGEQFVDAWRNGDQGRAIDYLGLPEGSGDAAYRDRVAHH